MGNTICLNDHSPAELRLSMSNQGTDVFLDLLILAASAMEKTEAQEELVSFLKERREINRIAPGTADFDLEELPWRNDSFAEDVRFLFLLSKTAELPRSFEQLPYEAEKTVVLPFLERFAEMIAAMFPEERTGALVYDREQMFFIYRKIPWQLLDHPWEPCLYLVRNDVIRFVLHNAFTVDTLIRTFSAGETVTDFGNRYDETMFRRILAAVIDSSRTDMDLFYAAKLVKD